MSTKGGGEAVQRRELENPKRILLFSGKRKCGKDFITDLLVERLQLRIGNEKAIIIKISSPIKSHWAEVKGLDLDQLMSSDEYKEKYRLEMIKWSEAVRNQDPGCFCKKAVEMYNAHDKPVWIVSDVRRKTDITWFRQEYGDIVRTIRVTAEEDVRLQRGFCFTSGVDDKASECDLDSVNEWNWLIKNNGDEEELEKSLELLIDDIDLVFASCTYGAPVD